MAAIPEKDLHIIRKYFLATSPCSILDIGLSFGKTRDINTSFLNQVLNTLNESESEELILEGVKTLHEYKDDPNLSIYSKVYEGHILNVVNSLGEYDWVIIGDILEYMSKEAAFEFIRLCEKHSKKNIIISVPLLTPDERPNDHASSWSFEDFNSFLDENLFHRYTSESHGVFLMNTGDDTVKTKKTSHIRADYSLFSENISKIDLSLLSAHVGNGKHERFFLDNQFMEHYKLLAHMSNQFNDVDIFDIGTNLGYSSLALSLNPGNRVISYDIVDVKDLNERDALQSIEFCIGDVLLDERLISSPLILLDTNHDGIFEQKFYSFLQEKNYKGILLLDDIHISAPMEKFWQSITHQKEDITDLGHWSGTGIVDFS